MKEFTRQRKKEAEKAKIPSSDEAVNTRIPSSGEEWVFMVSNEEIGGDRQLARWLINNMEEKVQIMLDSGAVTHVCPESFAPETPLDTERNRGEILKAANGRVLKRYGQKTVSFETDASNGEATGSISGRAVFQVLDVKKPIFSVSELCDKGHRVIFEKEGGTIERLDDGRRIYFHRC